MVGTNIFSKKYVRVLYVSFHSYRVVVCAPIPMGPRTPDFGSCSMSYSLLNCTGKVFGDLRPCLSHYRDERQMNLSYMVLLDMWIMFGQKFLSFIGG